MFDALRILSPLIHPVGLLWSAMLVCAVVCARRRQPLGAALLASLAGGLWLASQPWLLQALSAPLERPWQQHTLEQAPPHADAILILGGGWSDSSLDFMGIDLTEQADRWSTGLELGRRGVARHIVFGGDRPDQGSIQGPAPRSTRLAEWAERWFPGRFTFHTLGPVRTTRDEARAARQLALNQGWSNVVLVTSAAHMSRASATFRAEGVPIAPVACDFQTDPQPDARARFQAIPGEESLVRLARAWHEWTGRAVYRVFGFLRPSPGEAVTPPPPTRPLPPQTPPAP